VSSLAPAWGRVIHTPYKKDIIYCEDFIGVKLLIVIMAVIAIGLIVKSTHDYTETWSESRGNRFRGFFMKLEHQFKICYKGMDVFALRNELVTHFNSLP
jgi:hypothetical protein